MSVLFFISAERIDDKTKILTWEFTLETGENKSYMFNYHVDYKKTNVLYIEQGSVNRR